MTFNYNKDYEVRDSMLHRTFACGDANGGYDVFWFDNLDVDTLQKMVDMKFADPDEYQNSAPTIGEILEFMKRNPSFKAHGYAVTPNRQDYRLSIEGVSGSSVDENEIHDFVTMFRMADEFRLEPILQYAWYD